LDLQTGQEIRNTKSRARRKILATNAVSTPVSRGVIKNYDIVKGIAEEFKIDPVVVYIVLLNYFESVERALEQKRIVRYYAKPFGSFLFNYDHYLKKLFYYHYKNLGTERVFPDEETKLLTAFSYFYHRFRDLYMRKVVFKALKRYGYDPEEYIREKQENKRLVIQSKNISEESFNYGQEQARKRKLFYREFAEKELSKFKEK
jgi:hypothetical protein